MTFLVPFKQKKKSTQGSPVTFDGNDVLAESGFLNGQRHCSQHLLALLTTETDFGTSEPRVLINFSVIQLPVSLVLVTDVSECVEMRNLKDFVIELEGYYCYFQCLDLPL